MKCILMSQPGSLDVLQLAEVAKPSINSDSEVLVRMKAAGVNPVDSKLRSRGTYYPERISAILGYDGAGVIEAVGAGVSGFKPGDEIYHATGRSAAIPATSAGATLNCWRDRQQVETPDYPKGDQ